MLSSRYRQSSCELLYCARCCQSLPSESFPSKSGRRVKWKLTDGSLVCIGCVKTHFPENVGNPEQAECADNSVSLSDCATPMSDCATSSTTASARSSPFFSTPSSPKTCNSPTSTPIHVGHGTHAYEVKSQRLKATKKQLRLAAGGGRVEGNPLFVDLLHWLMDLQGLQFTRLTALVESDSSPPSCRLHSWGLACKGCNFVHTEQTLRLWNQKHRTTKAPSWMRSPPHLPGLTEVPLVDIGQFWADASEDSKCERGRAVQFVKCDGIVVWGRDMGEDGLETLRSFIQEIELGEDNLGSFVLPPPALACVAWPSDIWQRVLTFLSIREAARAGVAVLASNDVAAAADDAWDPFALLPGLSMPSTPSFRSFLAVARAAVLASRVFATFPRRSESIDREAGAWELDIARSCKTAQSVSTSACAMSLSNGLLAIAMESSVKLVRRSDLRSCGALGLKGSRRVSQAALTEEGQTLALAMQDQTDRCSKSELHFYSTEDLSVLPRTVKLPCKGHISSLHFMPAAESSVVVCGSSIFHLSAITGEIVNTWFGDSQMAFTSCQIGGPQCVVSATEGLVQLWDIRVQGHAAQTVVVESSPTAICMCTQNACANMPDTIIGTSSGELRRLDWRTRSVDACGSLPEKSRIDSLNFSNSSLLAVCPERMHMGFLGDQYVNIMSSTRSPTAVAASSDAWALAQSHGLRGRPEVVLVELDGLGSGGFREQLSTSVAAAKKAPKMFRKFEGNPHSQHAGKSGRSHCRRSR